MESEQIDSDLIRSLDPDQAYLLLAYYDKKNNTNRCSYLTIKEKITITLLYPLLPLKMLFIKLGICQPWKWRI